MPDVLPPELQSRPGEELNPAPRHGVGVRLLAILVVLALVVTTVGAFVFTFFWPLPM